MATHIMGRLSVRPHDAGGFYFYIQDRLTGARTQSSWELRIALWLAGTMAPRLAQGQSLEFACAAAETELTRGAA